MTHRQALQAARQLEDRQAFRAQRLIRKNDLPLFTGLRRTQIAELIKAGKFPKPIQIGERTVAWLESEVAAWQVTLIKAREQAR